MGIYKNLLKNLNVKYYMIGDCKKVASIKEAITDDWNLCKDM